MTMRGATSKTLREDNQKLERKLVAARARIGTLRGVIRLREARQLAGDFDLKASVTPVPFLRDPGKPPRFVQLLTQQRGVGYSVVIALDEEGQVWERHQTIDRNAKQVTDEWWAPWNVERRSS